MKTIQLIVVLGVLAITSALPVNDSQGKKLITGVFIPSAAFQNLENRANANSPNGQPMQGNPQPNYQPPNTNQQQYRPYQPPMNQRPQQPLVNNQPIMNQPPRVNQPVMTTQQINGRPNMQPVMSNQPVIYNQQPMTANRDPNTPIVMMTNQPTGQSNRPIVLVQQPGSNQPIYVQQQPQPQPTQVIIATNPSNQMQGTFAQPTQSQPNPPVYTLIPINGQNTISTGQGGSYSLIPVQSSGNTNPIILSTTK